MKSIQISLEIFSNIRKFTAITQDYPFEILLKSGKYVADAKSLLGVYALDLSKPLTVEIFSNDCDELLEKLKEFQV
ncbi:MAG: HPr family phosphocarrier protein [Clostridia bacterium]|nr:HPr family phosphocarrier protein [Clostridia bacterium]